MGNATRLSFQSHISLVQDLKPGEFMKKSDNVSGKYNRQQLFGLTALVIGLLCSDILWMAFTTNKWAEGGDHILSGSYGEAFLQ